MSGLPDFSVRYSAYKYTTGTYFRGLKCQTQLPSGDDVRVIMLYLGIFISILCYRLHVLIVFLCQAIRVVLYITCIDCVSVSSDTCSVSVVLWCVSFSFNLFLTGS